MGLYADKTTKLDNNENAMFNESTKINTHEKNEFTV